MSVPSLPRGNPLVPYGTPLHVAELTLALLRATFAALPEEHPYRFTDNYATTGILFDTSYNKDSGAFGIKPLVVVSRGGQSTAPIMTGDMATLSKALERKAGTTLVSASLDIQVRGRAKAETEIVGQHVFGMLAACRTLLPELAGVHMAENLSLSPVVRDDQDDAQFVARLSLSYVMQYRWSAVFPVEPLRAVGLAVNSGDLTMLRPPCRSGPHEDRG